MPGTVFFLDGARVCVDGRDVLLIQLPLSVPDQNKLEVVEQISSVDTLVVFVRVENGAVDYRVPHDGSLVDRLKTMEPFEWTKIPVKPA